MNKQELQRITKACYQRGSGVLGQETASIRRAE